jgi:hypothetical protein
VKKPVFDDPTTWGMRKPRDWSGSESWVGFCQRSYGVIFRHKVEQHRVEVEMKKQTIKIEKGVHMPDCCCNPCLEA